MEQQGKKQCWFYWLIVIYIDHTLIINDSEGIRLNPVIFGVCWHVKVWWYWIKYQSDVVYLCSVSLCLHIYLYLYIFIYLSHWLVLDTKDSMITVYHVKKRLIWFSAYIFYIFLQMFIVVPFNLWTCLHAGR